MTKRLALCNAAATGLQTGGIAFAVEMAQAQDGSFQPPEWIQISPRGAVTARDGRRFSFDPERLVRAHVEGGIHLPVDFDHETEMTLLLGARPARGWIVELQARPAGLFGRVEWLADAVAALSARTYRYISPAFFRDADGVTAILMKSAALVTSPALGMPAVASAHIEDASMDLPTLLAQLGLAATASATDAATAIAGLRTPDPAQYVPIAQHNETVAALTTAQATMQAAEAAAQAARCATLVEDAIKAGKITPGARDQYLALAKASFDGTKAAIEVMPALLKAGTDKPLSSVDDPADAADPVKLAAKATAYMDEQAARGITVSAADAVAHIQQGA